MAYYDGASKRSLRETLQCDRALPRDKEYDITQGGSGSKILYFTANTNSEAEVVKVNLHPNSNARIKEFEFDFSTIDIKGRGANGNTLTKFPVRKIDLKEKGKSTIGGSETMAGREIR